MRDAPNAKANPSLLPHKLFSTNGDEQREKALVAKRFPSVEEIKYSLVWHVAVYYIEHF